MKNSVLKFGMCWLADGSATAFGRHEFLGPFRLQLLHMKMNKACQVRSIPFSLKTIFVIIKTIQKENLLWHPGGGEGHEVEDQQDGQGQAAHGGEGSSVICQTEGQLKSPGEARDVFSA